MVIDFTSEQAKYIRDMLLIPAANQPESYATGMFVESRIKDLLLDILDSARAERANSETIKLRRPLCTPAHKVICGLISEIFKFSWGGTTVRSSDSTSCLIMKKELKSGVPIFDVNFNITWRPDNRFVYRIGRPAAPQASLIQALYQRALEGKGTDFCLAAEEGAVNLHKSVLAERCELLSTLVNGPMLTAGVIKVDASLNVVKTIVEFIYLDTLADVSVTKDLKSVYQLLKFSHMYQYTALFDHALHFLMNILYEKKPLDVEMLLLLLSECLPENFEEKEIMIQSILERLEDSITTPEPLENIPRSLMMKVYVQSQASGYKKLPPMMESLITKRLSSPRPEDAAYV